MSWITTYTGRRINPLDPRAEDVYIEDIAHALSLKCRWTGHVSTFYSVAQHSVLVAKELRRAGHSPRTQLAGLLHDASEAYLPDIASPIKGRFFIERCDSQRPGPPLDFRVYEDFLLLTICAGLDLPGLDGRMQDPQVRHADLVLLATEARDLMHGTDGWDWTPPEPRAAPIDPLDPERAEVAFLFWFEGLKQELPR
jgi:hypothetical protein